MLAELQDALGETYLIDRELARGGMSHVFLARDPKLGRLVVIKIPRSELAASLNVERFRTEIELAARLRHPNILPLLDAGMAGGIAYYTMPFIEGESLRDRLVRDGPLPVDDAVRLVAEVADALAYAHENGIVHRDIKPENILIDSGHAVVMDFGIARALSATSARALTATGLALGTPAYMSPEQRLGEFALDGRTDVYALGCVLHELVTGELPPTLGGSTSRLPRWLAPIVVKALAPTPEARFASAAAFRDTLREKGDGGLLRRSASWPKHVAGIALVSALILALATGIVIWRQRAPHATLRKVAKGQAHLTAVYENVPVRAILSEISALTGKTFVASVAAETVRVTARIDDTPWDVALMALLNSRSMTGEENSSGLVRVQTFAEQRAASARAPDVTQIIRVCNLTADSVAQMIRRTQPEVRIATVAGTNSVMITAKREAVDAITTTITVLEKLSAGKPVAGGAPQCGRLRTETRSPAGSRN